MSKINIRLASGEDVPVIYRLLTDLAGALGKREEFKSTEQDLSDYGFRTQPRFEALLAFEDAEAVGLAVFFPEYSTWSGTPGVYVQDLFVSDRLRGTGLGRDLLRAVQEHAGNWGSRYIRLTVHDGNQEAVSFYRHLGFELCDDDQVLVLRDRL